MNPITNLLVAPMSSPDVKTAEGLATPCQSEFNMSCTGFAVERRSSYLADFPLAAQTDAVRTVAKPSPPCNRIGAKNVEWTL